MRSVVSERRMGHEGVIVGENETLRLRVVRRDFSLGVIIDAIGESGDWTYLTELEADTDIQALSANGTPQSCRYFTFDPLYQEEHSVGMVLRGALGKASVAHTIYLSDQGPWCYQEISVKGLPSAVHDVTVCWRFRFCATSPEVEWPSSARHDGQPVMHPASFLQAGAHFLALVPDPATAPCRVWTEGGGNPGVTLGIGTASTDETKPLEAKFVLCADARALPERGFQQVVRYLCSRDEPTMRYRDLPSVLPPPVLPALQDSTAWRPFIAEGLPAEIASLTALWLARADTDWAALDVALCWLDRLCLHQSAPLWEQRQSIEGVAEGCDWDVAVIWLPALLLRAFALTGMTEYAGRALVLLESLPDACRAQALAALDPWGRQYLAGAGFLE